MKYILERQNQGRVTRKRTASKGLILYLLVRKRGGYGTHVDEVVSYFPPYNYSVSTQRSRK